MLYCCTANWARLLPVGLLTLATAATAQTLRPEVFVGLAVQPDVKTEVGRGGTRFSLSPVGGTAGMALRYVGRDGQSFGMRTGVAAFPIVQIKTITGFAVTDRPEELVLWSAVLEWSAPASSSRRWPPFVCAGVAHALSAPRTGHATTPTLGAGVRHWVASYAELRVGIDAALRPIGKSVFQIPFVVSFHAPGTPPFAAR